MTFIMILLSLVLHNEDFLTYEEGYKLYSEERRPLVVIVTTPGCAPCARMKTALKKLKEDFPNLILTEVQATRGRRMFPFMRHEVGYPQSVMYVYDSLEKRNLRYKVIEGAADRAKIISTWRLLP